MGGMETPPRPVMCMVGVVLYELISTTAALGKFARPAGQIADVQPESLDESCVRP